MISSRAVFTQNRALLLLSIASAATYLFATQPPLGVMAKVGSILLLWFIAARRCAPKSILVGLAFSAAGDLFLALPTSALLSGDKLFLLGLSAFLIAHCAYIVCFAHRQATTTMGLSRKIGVSLAVLVFALILAVLMPKLGTLRVPVVIYALALITMCIAAQRSSFEYGVAIGAMFFVASDAMLAFSRFRAPFAMAHALIWSTYFAAQLLIALGASRTSKSVEERDAASAQLLHR